MVKEKTKSVAGCFPSAGNMPKIQTAKKQLLQLSDRKSQRPFQLCRDAKKTNIKDVLKSKEHPKLSHRTSDKMPDEKFQHHTGWKAGPLKDFIAPKFTGKKYGISDNFPDLGKGSSAFDFMETQITQDDKKLVMTWTANKMRNEFFIKNEQGLPKTLLDSAVNPDLIEGKAEVFDLWCAAKWTVGFNVIGVNESKCWDRTSIFYNPKMDSAIPYKVYQVLNRYICFNRKDGALMDATEIQEEAARREAEWGVGGYASSEGSGSEEEDENVEKEEEEADEAVFGKVIERDCQLIYTAHDNETPAEVSPLQSHFSRCLLPALRWCRLQAGSSSTSLVSWTTTRTSRD